MAEEILLTKAGLEEKKAELDILVNERRREIAERLKEAISYGDLSENAEYDSAKNEQAELEELIQETEYIIKNAIIIDQKKADKSTVSLSVKVKVRDLKTKAEQDFIIIGSTEANPFEGKISNVSPVGAALLGKKVKDKVEIEVPGGKVKYEIVSIGNK